MFNLYIKTIEKNQILPTILAVILLFPLVALGPSTTTTTYAEVASNDKGSSSNLTSLDANTIWKIKKNTTDMTNQDDNSNKMTEIESQISNTVISKNQVKNETSSPINITEAISSTGSSDAATQGSEVTADFNGDGSEDKAIGVPAEHIDSIQGAGAVHVIYGSAGGLSATTILPDQLWTQSFAGLPDIVKPHNNFGAYLSSGDYNGDGHDDLVIGVPSQDFRHGPNAGDIQQNVGLVHVIYGSSDGLSATAVLPDQLWTQDSPEIEDVAETVDFFSVSLSSGDYNGDGSHDLAVGASREDIGTTEDEDTGAVHVIYGSTLDGLSATTVLQDQLWTQNSTDIEDFAEATNGFGRSLSSGDYNGDGNDDLAVGVPYEGIGSIISAGVVHVIYGSTLDGLSATAVLPDQLWTQDSPEIEDVAEANNQFGRYLSSGDYNGDQRDDLAVGVKSEGIGSIISAGAVHVIYGSTLDGLSATAVLPDQLWTQDSPEIEDVAETNDHFGGVSSGDYNADGLDDLAVGVQGEDFLGVIPGPGGIFDTIVDAGEVQVIYGSSEGLSATAVLPDQLWTQDSPEIEDVADDGDYFGSSL